MINKEQLIIDGVDVSECAYFDYENEGTRECDAYGNECEANNCYFKQFARKTQEYEQKEKELLSNEKIINKLMKEVDELKQECDTLKSQLDFEVQQKECIEQECEKLKEKFKKFFNIDNQECWDIAFLKDENARYRRALEEIEEVINNILNSCLGRNTVGCRPAHNVCGDLIKILNIINKTKDGNNE